MNNILTVKDLAVTYSGKMVISDIKLEEKSGGKSGEYKRG